ncbi:hypothetical protein ACK323_03920 [Aeromonas enteropelogenes]|uniref:hypothetical protein n=1 Tax=Aeromonas enteropelogenes TaxID=29489 RepID=UPI0039897F32
MKGWGLLLTCLLFAGCTQWPPQGYGGLAEVRPTRLPVNEDERRLWSGYDERQQELDQQLATLQQAHLRDCMPAGLKLLQSQRVDIVRDMHGRLWSEVAWRQAMLAQSLQQVRLQLEQTSREGCRADWSGLPLRQWGQT